MKETFIILFFLLNLYSTSGQTNAKLTHGFLFGYNLSSANGSSISKSARKFRPGFFADYHIRIKISNAVAFKMALSYDQNGWFYRSLKFAGTNGTVLVNGDVDYKLNYLTIPASTELIFGKRVKYYTDFGLFLGVLLNNRTIVKIYDPNAPNGLIETSGSSNSWKSTNFGIVTGAGLYASITKKIALEFKFSDKIGLQNIGKSGSNFKTNSLSISSGLLFRL